jgi:hypothetical protein
MFDNEPQRACSRRCCFEAIYIPPLSSTLIYFFFAETIFWFYRLMD